MKKKLHNKIIAFLLFLLPSAIYGQAPPDLGSAADFVIFTSNGAVTHTGAGMESHITGDVGVHIGGPFSGFGNVDGQMLDGGLGATVTDLNNVYLDLSTQGPATSHGLLFGAETLPPGIYSTIVGTPATLGGILTLDGGNDENAYFLFQIGFDFDLTAFAEVKLINGAKACNVFWLVEGPVAIATGAKMRGNIITHNASISIGTEVTLEGRALSINGAIAVNNGLTAYIPLGCNRPVLTGPIAPSLRSLSCYALFTSNGAMTNTNLSEIIGNVGVDAVGPNGWFSTPQMVTGEIHFDDPATHLGAADLTDLKNDLAALSDPIIPMYDIELLYPADLGHSLVLTPHVYWMGGAAHLVDTLFLNAQGNADAVFVIAIGGALTTGTYSNIVLQNGAQSSNVFWLVKGAVTISDYSTFRGTIVADNAAGAAIIFSVGDTLDGRALTTDGAITTDAMKIVINSAPESITPSGATSFCQGGSVMLTASSGASYIWSESGTPTGDITQSITVSTSGNYSVEVTSSCGTNSATAITAVTVNPTYTTNLNAFICNGDSLLIAGTYRKIQGSYSNILTSIKGCDSTIVTQLTVNTLYTTNLTAVICDGESIFIAGANRTTPGIYSDTLSSINGCDSIVVMELTSCSLEFFNGFSPNGDGHNDSWNIPVLNYYSDNSVLIINRWGSEVWKGINYDNTTNAWTGKNMKGDDLPDGTYYYIIKYNNTEKRGWVIIKR